MIYNPEGMVNNRLGRARLHRRQPAEKPISGSYHHRIGARMTWARSLQDGEPPETEQVVGGDRVTMIGRPSAGKSLLVGALLRQGRKSWHSFSDKDWMIIPNNAGRDDERNDIGELISLMNSFVQGRP